jgi:TadE-like protein
MLPFRILHRGAIRLLREVQGAALLEFAITLPLLVVFVVGIFDFSGAFNQKQKIQQAAQEGAIIAGAQPTSDIASGNANPDSLQPVVTAVFNSLAGSGVLPSAGASCTPPPPVPTRPAPPGLAWIYTISDCSGTTAADNLVITINRGWVCPAPCVSGPPVAVGTMVTVSYPYHWRFNSVIQLLFPGPSSYAPLTQVTESATVHNQM